MRGFDDIRGLETKYAVVMGMWFRGFLKRNYGFKYSTGMLLMMMEELNRPITREEWKLLAKFSSNSSIGQDLMVLETRGFIERYGVVREEFLKARVQTVNGRDKLIRSSVREIQSIRFQITLRGERVCETWRYNIRKRMDEFCATSLGDHTIYQAPILKDIL